MTDAEDPEAPSLTTMSDSELGSFVRETDVFRLAVACAEFEQSVREIRDNDVMWDRLIEDAMDNQTRNNVSSQRTAEDLITGFLDGVSEYADLARKPDELAAEAAKEANDE